MFDFSRTQAFGFKGDIFVGLTGAGPPGTGATDLAGYKVTRIDRKTGQVSDFIFHACTDNTPSCRATIFEPEGLNRPIDVHFRGPEMFIVDFGVAIAAGAGGGKIWKVTRSCDGGGAPMVGIIGMHDDGQPAFADAPCDQEDQGNKDDQGNQNNQGNKN
jgi:hypothetical protein